MLQSGCYENLLAVEADYEYFTTYNSDTAAVEDQIMSIINAISVNQYIPQLQTTFTIGTLIIRTTAASDPYSNVQSGGAILGAFRMNWESDPVLDAIDKDLVTV